MSKKQKKKHHSPTVPATPQESQAAEALTVLWVFSCLATLLAEMVAIGLLGVFQEMTPLVGLFLFISFVTGSLTMLMLPFVIRQRIQPPPRPIIIFSIAVSLPSPIFFLYVFLSWMLRFF